MTPHKILKAYALDSLDILRTSLDLAAEEKRVFYRVVALQLRLLLCDTAFRHNRRENISLLPELKLEIRLHPLGKDGFAIHQAAIPLADWLEQEIPAVLNPPVTIRMLIRRVCDQDGGAHIDPHPRASLPGFDFSYHWILTIGEYISSEAPGLLRQE